ncbi:hypothetical protein [Acinetobacter bereziniae]|uniref:hypothetical protein n=1 Tax=Acinetobacter bereziniae TaxID=106648 RepID=UPI0019002DE5|nr:hypothetical protein [Acinetobacter bereziniae]MBJ8554800.1 hypothetical protein [Acinetobacter bereziniae]
MSNRLLVYIVSLYLVLTPTIYAASPSSSGGGKWSTPNITRVALTDVIEATARQQAIRNGTSVTLEAVVQETINRRAIGQVILKRIFAGGLLVSASQSLIEGVGWVIENGAYVKYKDASSNKDKCFTNTQCQIEWKYNNVPYPTAASACQAQANDGGIYKGTKDHKTYPDGTLSAVCLIQPFVEADWSNEYLIYGIPNPNYKPDQNPQTKVVLTPEMAGNLAVGDYVDPVDEKYNKKDKVWTDVENSYKPDVTGNDLNDRINNKFDNAPETDTKPTTKPKIDGDGQKYPAPDTKPGGQGETETKPDGQGTFTLPDWCTWAADNCQWHQEDKQHQTEEKSFWSDIRDWFNWTKEEPTLEDDSLEIDQDDITDYQRKDYVTFGKTCPFSPHQVSLPLGILGQLTFEADLTFICTFGNEARPFVIGLGYLGGFIFLLVGLRNGNG